jgi:serine protease Do
MLKEEMSRPWIRSLRVLASRYSVLLIVALLGTQALAVEDAGTEISTSRVSAIVTAARAVGPAVVSISVIQTRLYAARPFPGLLMDPMMRDYFGDFFAPRVYKEQIQSLGSGLIVRRDGYILTNEHVVRGAEQIRVTLPDGRVLDGELVDSEPYLDLAVVRVDGEALPAAPLGDSDKLIIGEWAIAIGNPFGYLLDDTQPTVTVGVISALRRAIRPQASSPRLYRDMIQTDAAINPGNSGGPLVNADGEVIGINTFIFTSGGGSEGIGFARPVNDAKRVLSDVVSFGRIRRAWIGAHTQSVNEDIADALGLKTTNGVIIGDVDIGSPAEKAGLRRGDLITVADGAEIGDEIDWETSLLSVEVGDTLNLSIVRQGKGMKVGLFVKELQRATR